MKKVIFSLFVVLISLTSFTPAPAEVPNADDWVYKLNTSPLQVIKGESPLLFDWGNIYIVYIRWNQGGGNPDQMQYQVNYDQRNYNRAIAMYTKVAATWTTIDYDVVPANTIGYASNLYSTAGCSGCHQVFTIDVGASTVSWDY